MGHSAAVVPETATDQQAASLGMAERHLAEHAWFKLGIDTLTLVAQKEDCDISQCVSAVETLAKLTVFVLQCSEMEAMTFLRWRFHEFKRDAVCDSDLLEVDEALACFKEEDRLEVVRRQKTNSALQLDLQEFQKQYRTKIQDLRRGGPGKGGGKLGGGATYRGPKKWVNGKLQQTDLRTFAAPNSYVWRSRTGGEWKGRHSDCPEKSCRDTAWGGEENAARRVLQWTWEWWCICEGKTLKDVPIVGLFEKAATLEKAAI